jgi:hypothetical protein
VTSLTRLTAMVPYCALSEQQDPSFRLSKRVLARAALFAFDVQRELVQAPQRKGGPPEQPSQCLASGFVQACAPPPAGKYYTAQARTSLPRAALRHPDASARVCGRGYSRRRPSTSAKRAHTMVVARAVQFAKSAAGFRWNFQGTQCYRWGLAHHGGATHVVGFSSKGI